MHSRRTQDQELIKLPSDWLNDLRELLNTTYKDQCIKDEKSFLVLGHTYPNEVVLIVSFLDEKNLSSIPITLVLSVDLDEKSNSDKLLEVLVEFVGVFFDEVFANENWDGYNLNWEMESLKNSEIYYFVSRENILLSMKADELLKE